MPLGELRREQLVHERTGGVGYWLFHILLCDPSTE